MQVEKFAILQLMTSIELLSHEGRVVPITALHWLEINSGSLLIVVAQGAFLKIIHSESHKVLFERRIFLSQCIHGATSLTIDSGTSVKLVVWGGRELCELHLAKLVSDGRESLPQFQIGSVKYARCPDWILDTSICTHPGPQRCQVAFLTSSNLLFQVDFSFPVKGRTSVLGSPSNSTLYCARVVWVSETQILIAGGTVFGEIILWSYYFGRRGESNEHWLLHQKLIGHEGSIFGVDLSEGVQIQGDPTRRFLASCSDDRMIRVWDITDLARSREGQDHLFESQERETQTGFRAHDPDEEPLSSKYCIAKGWGHESRIWSVKFLHSSSNRSDDQVSLTLISCGEDAKSEIWQLSSQCSVTTDENISAAKRWGLDMLYKVQLHSGKNIWAMSSVPTTRSDRISLVATGGADGRVATFKIDSILAVRPGRKIHSWTSKEIEECQRSTLESTFATHGQCPTTSCGSPASIYSASHSLVEDHATKLNASLECGSTEKHEAGSHVIPLNSFKSYLTVGDTQYIGLCQNGVLAFADYCCGLKGRRSLLDEANLRWSRRTSHFGAERYLVALYCRSMESLFLIARNKQLIRAGLQDFSIQRLVSLDYQVARIFHQEYENRTVSIIDGAFVFTKNILLVLTYHQYNAADILIISDRSDAQETRHQAGPDGEQNSTIISRTSISLPSYFLVSSMAYAPQESALFLGSRSGHLVTCPLSEALQEGRSSIPLPHRLDQVHDDGINQITPLRSDNQDTTLLTISEDGSFAVSRKIKEGETVTLHRSFPKHATRLSGCYFHADTGHLMLYGFSTNDFIVWNETIQLLHMQHRIHGVRPPFAFYESRVGPSQIGRLIYTQGRDHYFAALEGDSDKVTQSATFGREIKALAIRRMDKTRQISDRKASSDPLLFACGSEGCTVQLVEYLTGDYRSRGVFKRHDAGIQHLQWSSSGRFLLSCGGRGEFLVWKYNEIPVLEHGMVLQARIDVKTGGHDTDVRIMDFDICEEQADDQNQSLMIALVTSTSIIEGWQYEERAKAFTRLSRFEYLSCAILQVKIINLGHTRLVLIGATDGYLVVYPFPPSDAARTHLILATLRAHQSAVKALTIQKLDNCSYLVVTGGDDNALHICLLTQIRGSQSKVALSTLDSNIHAHSAAINCTALICTRRRKDGSTLSYFASAGNDCRVKMWRVSVSASQSGDRPDSGKLENVASLPSDVADASAMDVIERSNEEALIFVSGVGVETLKVNLEALK